MGKSSKKYTKPVGKVKRRKKLQTSQNQYAQPTSFQVTSTQQNISEDPEKAAQMLEMENMTQRQRLKAQRQAQKEKIQAAKDARVGEFEDAAGQGLEYLGEAAKEKAKKKAEEEAAKKVAEEAAKKTAETAAAVVPNVVTPTTSAATSGVSSASAQTLATQGSGMSQAYGNQLLNQQILNEGTKTTATTAGKTAATSAGKAGLMGTQSAAVTPIALGANLAGTAIKAIGTDDDDTTYNAAEVSGGLLQKAGEFGGYGAMLGTVVPGLGNVAGGIIGGVVGLGVGGAQMLNRKKKAKKEKSEQDAKDAERDLQYGLAQQDLFRQAYGTSGFDKGYNIGQSVGNSYLGGNQMAQGGGKKVPGGKVLPLPGGAVEFRGNKHGQSGLGSDSGIILEKSTKDKAGLEVEDKETMDKIKFADGNTDDYIFSSYLKLGGKSFAQRHKDILNKGGSQKKIQDLAKLQEEKAKDVKKTPVGPTDQYGPRGKEYIARYGGVKPRKKAQMGNKGFTSWNVGSPNYEAASERIDKRAVEAAATQQSDKYNQYQENVNSVELLNVQKEKEEYERDRANSMTSEEAVNTQGSQTTRASQPTEPPVEYRDETVDVGGVQYSTEDFKNKGIGTNIDFSGDINSNSWSDVLQTNWAENFLADDKGKVRTDLSKQEVQDIYNEEYIPEVQEYFESNPEAAYDATVAFANSGNPNASNLRKRIYNADGSLKSKEEVLKVALKNATDGKVGTFHSIFAGKEDTQAAPPEEKKEQVEEVEEAVKTVEKEKEPEEVKDASPRVKAPKLRAVPPLAYATLAGNLVGPLAALATKLPKPTTVSTTFQGKERLGRVNYNAERAADLNNTTALNRSIENTASGPAGIVAKMAANNRSRENFNNIANQEARQNQSLANAEKNMNQAITARNIQNAYSADARNAAMMDKYELAKKQKNVQALSDAGLAAGQFATDVMQYQRDERVSDANQLAGEYTRRRYYEKMSTSPKWRKLTKDMTEAEKRDLAASMYQRGATAESLDKERIAAEFLKENPDLKEDDKKYGGRKYVKRSGKVKRKKKK